MNLGIFRDLADILQHICGVRSQFFSDTKIVSVDLLSPSCIMGGDLSLRWEFRRKDNDDDSSSDESKSVSEAAHQKRKLVSSLVSVETDEENGTHGVEQNIKTNTHSDVRIVPRKNNNVKSQRSRKENSFHEGTGRNSYEGSSKMSRASTYKPADMDEVKRLRESLLEDFSVTRENLLNWMKQEVQKLVADDILPAPKQGKESLRGKNLRVQHGEYFENANSEERKQVDNKRKFEESIQIHGKDVMVPHGTNIKGTIQAQDQKSFEEADVQVQCRRNFESGIRAQQCNIGSLVGTGISNQATGCDNGYNVLRQQADNGHTARALIPAVNFGSSVRPNFMNVRTQHQMDYPSGIRPQNYGCRSLGSPLEGKYRAQSNDCQPWITHPANYVRDVRPVASSEVGRARLTVPNNSSIFSDVSGQIASSMCLTSPSILTSPYGENHSLGTSSYSYIQPTVSGNRLAMNYENANTMLKANSHHGNFMGTSHQEINGSISRLVSHNMSYINRQNIVSPSIGTGFSVAPHQGMDFGVTFPSQASIRYLSRDEKNTTEPRMNEGPKMFRGGSCPVPQGNVSNSSLNHSISTPQGTQQAFQKEKLEEGNV